MKSLFKTFALVVACVGFLAALPVEVAAADIVKTRQAVMKELSAHNKAIGVYLRVTRTQRENRALARRVISNYAPLRWLASPSACQGCSQRAPA